MFAKVFYKPKLIAYKSLTKFILDRQTTQKPMI